MSINCTTCALDNLMPASLTCSECFSNKYKNWIPKRKQEMPTLIQKSFNYYNATFICAKLNDNKNTHLLNTENFKHKNDAEDWLLSQKVHALALGLSKDKFHHECKCDYVIIPYFELNTPQEEV